MFSLSDLVVSFPHDHCWSSSGNGFDLLCETNSSFVFACDWCISITVEIPLAHFFLQNGFTPLHIAAKYGNLNVAGVLIQHGANVDYKTKVLTSEKHVCMQNDFLSANSNIIEISGRHCERPVHLI